MDIRLVKAMVFPVVMYGCESWTVKKAEHRRIDAFELWNSNILGTLCEELTHWKRPWCWEGLGAGEEGDNRGWDGWMASLTWWTWAWVNSGSWWWTGRPGMLQFMGSQRVGHNWATEHNWRIVYCYREVLLLVVFRILQVFFSAYMKAINIKVIGRKIIHCKHS